MVGVEQNRYKTNNGCIKHLPQTGSLDMWSMKFKRMSHSYGTLIDRDWKFVKLR